MKTARPTNRVFLRRLYQSDEAAIIALAKSSRAFHRNRVKPPDTPAGFAKYLKRGNDKSNAMFVVCLKSDKTVIGAINFSQIFYGQFKSAYMGYWIGAAFANQGYMSEAMQLAVHIAFKKLKLHRIEANIIPDNIPSIKLVKRLGFRKEGYSLKYLKIGGKWRDHIRFAMFAEEWNR